MVIGVCLVAVAPYLSTHNPPAYTVAALFGVLLIRPLAYSIIVAIAALALAASRRDVGRFWLPAFAWLLLAAGLFNVLAAAFTRLGFR